MDHGHHLDAARDGSWRYPAESVLRAGILCIRKVEAPPRRWLRLLALALIPFLAACGGGAPPPITTGTLAYVETECRTTKQNDFYEQQALRIRQGDHEPLTVFETPEVGPVPYVGTLLCNRYGRWGDYSISREAFQAVAVSPDGASVVFLVTDEFSVNPPLPLNLPPEQKGLFWVRADGTGLRRLGPPSRERFFYVVNGSVFQIGTLRFSPDGRTITFVDKGPDTDGHEADQVVTVDVASGTFTQVTHLPPAHPPAGWPANAPTVRYPFFRDDDDRTIIFLTSANPDGLNPEGREMTMMVQTDGSHLEVPIPISVAAPGALVDQRFVITGDRPQVISVAFQGDPANDPPLEGPQVISEVFVVDQGKNTLQLTNFGRVDTNPWGMDIDLEHVYFAASADPLGTNPSYNCQLFSIDRLGNDLRQLTNFYETEHSLRGCYFGAWPQGCAIHLQRQARSRALVFYSTCDPFGTNPNGGQVFALQPDGTGLRQLTNSRGSVTAADGTVTSQLPGPWDYGPNTVN
jgi:hypothetical protein